MLSRLERERGCREVGKILAEKTGSSGESESSEWLPMELRFPYDGFGEKSSRPDRSLRSEPFLDKSLIEHGGEHVSSFVSELEPHFGSRLSIDHHESSDILIYDNVMKSSLKSLQQAPERNWRALRL
jgi:hypothetical protein